SLPREQRRHELAEAERVCPGCGQVRVEIGVDKSEQLDYRPASLFVIEHYVHKYACPCCSQQPVHAPGHAAGPMSTPPRHSAAASGAGLEPEQTAAHPELLLPHPAPTAMPLPPAPPQPVPVVIAAPRPATPIAKGIPGPGLLAHLIVSKYTDHMPLH